MKQNFPHAIGGLTYRPKSNHSQRAILGVDINEFYTKPKSTSTHVSHSSRSIHPLPQPRARLQRKRRNHEANHAARAEANRRRSHNKNEPNWHGTGRHAGLS